MGKAKETDTTSCMCGARSGLIGAFAADISISLAVERKSRRASSLIEQWAVKNTHGVERFVRQGAYGADLSLYEVDVVFEEYGRVGIVWLCGGKRPRGL